MKERIVCVVHGGTVFAGSPQKQQDGPEQSVRLNPGLHDECQKGDPGNLFQVSHPSFASQEERGLVVFRLALRLKAETQGGPFPAGEKRVGGLLSHVNGLVLSWLLQKLHPTHHRSTCEIPLSLSRVSIPAQGLYPLVPTPGHCSLG